MTMSAVNNPVIVVDTDDWRGVCEKLIQQNVIDHPLILASAGAVQRFLLNEVFPQGSIYSSFSALTDKNTMQQLLNYCKSAAIDGIIGIGGGSILDSARIAHAAIISECYAIDDLLAYADYTRDDRPLILIPTTHGSGSEMTKWATVWDVDNKKKHSISHDALYADVALLDPQLTATMPHDMIVSSSLDALSHSFEVLWNKNKTAEVENLAVDAICDILTALPEAVKNPDDLSVRRTVLLASNRAGLAFSQTQTAAAHAISYPLTMDYGISHGIAAAMPLIPLLKRFYAIAGETLAVIAKKVEVDTPDELISAVEQLLKFSSQHRLRDFSVQKEDIQDIANRAYTPERMMNFAADISKQDMIDILMEMY